MTDVLTLLDVGNPLTGEQDRALADSCRGVLAKYRAAVLDGTATPDLAANARRAFLHLSGDPERSTTSLRDYDHDRYGPFLGVSDEGSAASAIRDAALESPKMLALASAALPDPLAVGVAVDAERLVGVGEVVVGPEEYADIWLATVGRVLITTNIGTQVNVRVYRPEPRVEIANAGEDAIVRAKSRIAEEFKPFVQTPDLKPRPRTVFVEFAWRARITEARKRAVLKELVRYVSSGDAARPGQNAPARAPEGHVLGLAVSVGGAAGKDMAIKAIELAANAGAPVLLIDGSRGRTPTSPIARGGLRDYFEPGGIAQILREGQKRGVQVRAANLPDTDTIARSIWVGLNTARTMGAHLGKYGCVPMTLPEIDYVVQQIQGWLPTWSAAPVFFVDQGIIREGKVDVGNDLPRGIEEWLKRVAAHGVRIVLIDTVDKSTGRRLLRKSAGDKTGYLGPKQIDRIEKFARGVGIKVLWAGGLGLRDAYEMGRRGVFGIYVTSAAATTIPVGGSYVRDPALAGMKEPSRDAVLRTKTLLEAGFLSSKLAGTATGEQIAAAAELLLAALDAADASAITSGTAALASACVAGWQQYWRR